MAGVSVRTLHHYDEIGLLRPSKRSESGYRQYSPADLLRLQQILLHRELGMPLREIGALLDAPDFDAATALREHRRRLMRHADRTREKIRAVDLANVFAPTMKGPGKGESGRYERGSEHR